MYDLQSLWSDRRSRRAFLTAMTAAGLGLAADRLLGNGAAFALAADAGPSGGPTDGASQFASIPGADINVKVLNFALTLEILEADLYRQALNYASGKPLGAALASDPNAYKRVVGPGGLSQEDKVDSYRYLVQFTYVEAAHRDFLMAALGSAAVKRNPAGYKFPKTPSPDMKGILSAILPLEETGVRAYLGALPYLTDLGLAQTAGSIFSTEARHSAAVRYTLGLDPGPVPGAGDLKVTPSYPSGNTFEYYLQPKTVLQIASQFFA